MDECLDRVLDELLRNAPIGLGFLDTKLRYLRVNEDLAQMNGVPAHAHLGRTVTEVLGVPGRTLERVMREVLATGRPVVRWRVTDGELGLRNGTRSFEGSIYPVHVDGATVGLGVVVEETTERTLEEEERRRLFREAQDAIRARDEFLSIASHELKTPLTPLAVRLAALERKLRAGETVDPLQIQKARRSVDRLTALINDLLDATRITAGRLSLHLAPMQLDELIGRVVRDTPRDSHPIRLEAPDFRVSVFGDPARLEQVMENLLDNAAKYSPPGTEIAVCLEVRGDMALLSVRDRGMGIPSEQQARLFERFFRASNAAGSRTGGLGLGLYICRDIVERHGGHIWVRSKPGRGSTFYVGLPTVSAWRGLSSDEHAPL